MPNYNSQLQSNNTDLQMVLQTLQTKAAGSGGEQATPVILIDSTNGLITAIAGTKTSTHQLAFQTAKTITPSTASQIAVYSGYYTGGNITVEAIPSQYIVPSGTLTISANGTHDVKNYASAVVSVDGNGYDETDSLITRTFSAYTNNRVSSIGAGAFYGYTSLVFVNFPNCINIGGRQFPGTNGFIGAFANCSALTTISFPACTTINYGAFYNCYKLTTASFPVCTTIDSGAFYNCGGLTTASFPVCTTIGKDAFYNCYKLTTASFPVCTTIDSGAFYNCGGLTTASFPVCTTIGKDAFFYCSKLTTINFPVCTTVSSGAFYNCFELTTASFPACTTISYAAFFNCYNLKSLYLTGSSICTLSNSNAFRSTPIDGYSASAGTYGSIYVPASLLTSYQTATNWTYFSSRFVAFDGGGTGDAGDLITFTIDGVEYQAEEGMTWGEWCESTYNTTEFIEYNGTITQGVMDPYGDYEIVFIINYDDFSNVSANDIINAGYNYIID